MLDVFDLYRMKKNSLLVHDIRHKKNMIKKRCLSLMNPNDVYDEGEVAWSPT
jgi:hypothetical protein